MSRSTREELIQEVIEKHGRDAEAPAREVAQVYEDELHRVESQYKELERAAINEDRKAANSIKLVALNYIFLGLGLGVMAATFATYELIIAGPILYLIGAIMLGVSLIFSFML
jgi:hypothetical protein